jgi:hypothetical protein
MTHILLPLQPSRTESEVIIKKFEIDSLQGDCDVMLEVLRVILSVLEMLNGVHCMPFCILEAGSCALCAGG